MATYPLAVKTFTQKRNLLDDVDASHINDIQSEIVALETALGTTPTKDKVTGATYATVGDRISAVRGGAANCAFWLSQTTSSNSYSAHPTNLNNVALGGKWFDYAGGSNGTGYTIKETGVYMITAGVSFGAVAIRGNRNLVLRNYPLGGNTYSNFMADSFVVPTKESRWSGKRCNLAGLYPFNKGDKISLWVGLDNDGVDAGKFTVTWARMHGFKVRDR